VNQQTPAARDRAQRRVRVITTAAAAGAGVLTLAGAAAAAGTFAGRTVGANTAANSSQTVQNSDAGNGFQQPNQLPSDGSGYYGGGQGYVPVSSGGS
jgi:hypothetical protein